MVEILYIFMYENGKMRPIETIPGIHNWIHPLWYTVRAFVIVTKCTRYNNNIFKKTRNEENTIVF
jgi:hypothetical protein